MKLVMKKKMIYCSLLCIVVSVALFFCYTGTTKNNSVKVSSVVMENAEAFAYSVTESDGSLFDCEEPYDNTCFESQGVSYPGTKR